MSGDRRDAIRMLDERSGKWLTVTTPVASDKGIFSRQVSSRPENTAEK